jgi:hypothetical protein
MAARPAPVPAGHLSALRESRERERERERESREREQREREREANHGIQSLSQSPSTR